MNHQQINSRSSHYSGITFRDHSFETHFHNSYELICVLKGSIKVTVNSQSAILREKDFILIPPCMLHSISESRDAIFFIAIITADYIPDFFAAHKKNETPIFSVDEISFDYLKKYLFEKKYHSDYQLKACFYIILSFAEQGKCLLASNSINYDFVFAVNSYIADHFTEPIRRAQLAEVTGYEEHYFSSLFQKNFGSNLCQYVNSQRISYALKLLSETDSTVSQIALECGFSSVKEFNNAFMLQMNETPSQYRKKHRVG